MRKLIALVALLAFTGKASADVNMAIAKDQAKRQANQSNTQQGVTPSQPPAPSTPQQPPMDPALAATLQNVADLRADLDALTGAAARSSAFRC